MHKTSSQVHKWITSTHTSRIHNTTRIIAHTQTHTHTTSQVASTTRPASSTTQVDKWSHPNVWMTSTPLTLSSLDYSRLMCVGVSCVWGICHVTRDSQVRWHVWGGHVTYHVCGGVCVCVCVCVREWCHASWVRWHVWGGHVTYEWVMWHFIYDLIAFLFWGSFAGKRLYCRTLFAGISLYCEAVWRGYIAL